MGNPRTVGLTGENVSDDVEVVQRTLSQWLEQSGLPPLEITGTMDPATVAAIGSFQLTVGALPGDLEVYDEGMPIALTQGQGEGNTIKEAAKAARDACVAQLSCAQGVAPKVGKYTCWKGGNLTYTCTVQCGCEDGIV